MLTHLNVVLHLHVLYCWTCIPVGTIFKIRRQLTVDHEAPQIFAYFLGEVAFQTAILQLQLSFSTLDIRRPYVCRCCIRRYRCGLFGNGRFVGWVSAVTGNLHSHSQCCSRSSTWDMMSRLWHMVTGRNNTYLCVPLHVHYVLTSVCKFVMDKVPST
jgi:hypothetical protein